MQMLLNQEGDWVSFDDYEWLRKYTARQLEQHIKENSQLRLDNAMLKARLEMLESAILSGNAITPDAEPV
jgi:regulator of replication initiation timing